ncbi:Metallo-dependent phosphatase-like protein [Phellopilus nigrolimitatus]|nr:Metallo-dependent phosphatase-like protein [Phellopilus nigrolimitatus]
MLSITVAFALLVSSLNLRDLVSACPDVEHSHNHAKRSFPTGPITAPTRPLVWGDVNVIHTTDTHGWLLGHQKPSPPEPNYSGDFGDFASFVTHMNKLALEKDVDLLLVDTGDVHDGTGLSDGFPPGDLDAHDSDQFIKQLPYDVLSIGNHELSDGYAVALDMYTDFAPFWKGRYLSSNVNITVFDESQNRVSVPIGERFVKFETRKGRKVTSIGVLFDFTGNAENTTVQTVEDMVDEQWFKEAIEEEPDFFLLIGHMPVSRDNWPTVFSAVRAVHPTTPILIFGGHTHIRDCLQFDGRSMALESGRYMETIGWMSVALDEQKLNKEENLTFTRRYLDQNRITYEFHAETSNQTFDTQHGQSITSGLNQLAEKFDLSFQFGTAPHDFLLTRAPFPSNNSLLSLFIQEAAPVALNINNTRANIPNIMITNSGSQRFDVLQGPFTRNDQFTASPFSDSFLFISNVTFAVANEVLPALNNQGAQEKRAILYGREEELYAHGYVDIRYLSWLREMAERDSMLGKRTAENLTLGYVTSDACPGIGDDVPHSPLPFFSTPDFIGSNPPNVTDDTPIDLVFVDFIETQLLGILNTVSNSSSFTSADVQSYSPFLANQVLGLFAQEAWN